MSEIGNVTNSQVAAAQQTAAPAETKNNTVTQEAQEAQSATVVAQDEYVGSVEQAKTGNYNRNGYKVDMDKINEMKADMKNNMGAFKVMLQGIGSANAASGTNMDNWSDWVKTQFNGQMSAEEAAKAVSDEGYWGVEETSNRIVEFAKSLSGGDMSKYDTLLGAIEKGFGAAKDEWGKDMPDITQKTYDAVMEKMQAWKDEESGTASTSGVLEK